MRISLRIVIMFACIFVLAFPAMAQWNLTWTSSGVPSGVVSGWLQFQQTGGHWQYRLYTLDTLAFRIMTSPFSQTPQCTYTFTAAERLAGELIYSLGHDVNGDGIVDFYVLAANGASSPYRMSAKVFDITTGQSILARDVAAYSYSSATVWDADADGILDCVFTRSDYPSGTNYSYEAYNTGISGGVRDIPQTPKLLNLRQNYPNPFNPSTRIDYDLAVTGRVELEIVNVLGQSVTILVNDVQTAGAHSVLWDGTDGNGRRQASGAYYYQIRVNDQALQARQMMLLK
jgi:hypothetical protein